MKNVKRGFTLIELLVVISIIALLVSILMPALGKARAQARMVLCMTRQRSIVQSVNMYLSDNGKLPPSTQGKENGWWTIPMRLKYYYSADGSAGGLNGGSVTKVLGSYMESAEYFDCPVARHSTSWQNEYLNALDDENVNFLNCSYFLLWNWKKFADSNPSFRPTDRGKDTLMTSDIFLFNEGQNNAYHHGTMWISSHRWDNSSLKTFADAMSGGTLNADFKFWMADDPSGMDWPEMRLNAGYLDGRVETISSDEYEIFNNSVMCLPPRMFR